MQRQVPRFDRSAKLPNENIFSRGFASRKIVLKDYRDLTPRTVELTRITRSAKVRNDNIVFQTVEATLIPAKAKNLGIRVLLLLLARNSIQAKPYCAQLHRACDDTRAGSTFSSSRLKISRILLHVSKKYPLDFEQTTILRSSLRSREAILTDIVEFCHSYAR